jgi:dolichol-phosphate mannosyltransferase
MARFVRFCLVGLSGALVDMAIFWLLTARGHWGFAGAKCVSTEIAIFNNFVWNDLWTFAGLDSGTSRLKRFFKFNAICAGGLFWSLCLLYVQITWLGMNRYLANAAAIVLVTAWNFGMNRLFSWSAADVQVVVPSPATQEARA